LLSKNNFQVRKLIFIAMFSNSDIARYYDVSEIHYRRHWDLNRSHALHYGFWDSTTKNFHQALLNINKILADKAGITAADKVLDAGCGVGGSSVWLGVNRKCTVTGISLSTKQTVTATALAKKRGVENSVSFERRDFTNTGFADSSFDVVWAIESVCHAADKNDFITEAFRILKPGGRLIMADFFKLKNLAKQDNELIKRWAEGWAVNDFATWEDFNAGLIDTGFKNIINEDATQAILPSAKRLYIAYFPGAILGYLYRLFNRKATEFGKRNVDTAYLQYKSLKKNLWKYRIVMATKT
jgi:cyclopropane fatty-acyl-phospholipid synthase-like methyltransferase